MRSPNSARHEKLLTHAGRRSEVVLDLILTGTASADAGCAASRGATGPVAGNGGEACRGTHGHARRQDRALNELSFVSYAGLRSAPHHRDVPMPMSVDLLSGLLVRLHERRALDPERYDQPRRRLPPELGCSPREQARSGRRTPEPADHASPVAVRPPMTNDGQAKFPARRVPEPRRTPVPRHSTVRSPCPPHGSVWASRWIGKPTLMTPPTSS